jgi:hypothetical protein
LFGRKVNAVEYRSRQADLCDIEVLRPGLGRLPGMKRRWLVAGVAAVVMLASDGQPVQAGVPSEAAIHASIDDGAIVDDVVRAEP